METRLPSRVLLDVPAVEARSAVRAGAVRDASGRLWVDPQLVKRHEVALWLKPRMAESTADNDYANATVLAMPYRCWHRDCREESLAVVAYGVSRSSKVRGRPDHTNCSDGSDLELVAAALRRVRDLPDDLASLGRRFSRTAGEVYMSNGCRICQRIFGRTPLADAFIATQEIGWPALVKVAEVRLRSSPLKQTEVPRSERLLWHWPDWVDGEKHFGPVNAPLVHTGLPEKLDPKARIARSRSRPFGGVWGSGLKDLGGDELTVAEFEELLAGWWDSVERIVPQKAARFDRSIGRLIRDVPGVPGGFDCWLGAEPALVELLLSIDDDQHFAEVEDALIMAAVAAAKSLEANARIARVPPKMLGLDPQLATARASGTQGGPTIAVPARIVMGPVLRCPPAPSRTTSPGSFSGPRAAIHLLIPRLCWLDDPTEGGLRYYTADEAGIRRQAAERNGVFMKTLATGLETLGYHPDGADKSVSWTLEGSNPLFAKAWTQANEPMRAVLSEMQRRGVEKPTAGQVLAELRTTRAARDKLVRVFDRAASRQDLFDRLADFGASPGLFRRRSPEDGGPAHAH